MTPNLDVNFIKLKMKLLKRLNNTYFRSVLNKSNHSHQNLVPSGGELSCVASLIPPIPPLRGETGYPALAPIEKAEVLADTLRKQFEPNTDPMFDNPIVSGKVKEAVESFANTPHINNLSPVTASEVIDFIKTLKPNKSPRLDQISNSMLKNLPLKCILYLTFLMNVLMQNCYFTKCWKGAVQILHLEEGGGLMTAGESSKSSDMLYYNVSPSEEEELISASASDSRDCKILFSNGGRTAIGKSSMSTEVGESFFSFFLFVTSLKSVKPGEAEAISLNGATGGKEGTDRLVIAEGALGVEADRLELESAEISGLVWVDGPVAFFHRKNLTISGCCCLRF
ncbi:hypothetical protein AVEN_264356-1 [Araneus ventricosus]|uniref:Uncharacterized protein n=1 Tax=Araneus ventricosus TaxID=182803 RepID=A0A4Y2H764_ARAVE|nr:hypothetical protein AVEN_264356-1 [Araneus ventricosus]